MKKARFAIAAGLIVVAGLAGAALAHAGRGQASKPAAPASTDTLIINADLGRVTISKNVFGQFAEHIGRCIYGGIWVGENSPIPNTRGIRNDVVAALRQAKVPVLRWPGGCFADAYHWTDGVGPKDKRPSLVNATWGGVVEDNHFGTHEFMDLCEQVGCEPYFTGNVGSGTVKEMKDWVEYVTYDGPGPLSDWRRANGRDKAWRLSFFGVGNETWGCGGSMRAEYYADVYRRYQTYLNDYSGNKLFKIACGPSDDDYAWTETLMKAADGMMDGLSLHYYTVPGGWDHMTSATSFGEAEWFDCLKRALRMEELVSKHSTVMDRYDPEKRVGLMVDEWGTWYKSEPGLDKASMFFQQNTVRDAVVAGATLNIFANHADRVRMACIAQVVNILQSLILTQDEKFLVTPTFWVFEMYKVHQDATLLPVTLNCGTYGFGGSSIPAVSASASRDKQGRIHISLCNLDPNKTREVVCELRGVKAAGVSGRILTSTDMTAHNTFEKPDAVRPAEFKGARLEGNVVRATLPPRSVVVLEAY